MKMKSQLVPVLNFLERLRQTWQYWKYIDLAWSWRPTEQALLHQDEKKDQTEYIGF